MLPLQRHLIALGPAARDPSLPPAARDRYRRLGVEAKSSLWHADLRPGAAPDHQSLAGPGARHRSGLAHRPAADRSGDARSRRSLRLGGGAGASRRHAGRRPLRVLQALGGCAGKVIPRAVVRDLFKHHEVMHVFSMLMLVMGLAPFLAPFLGGLMLQVASWRMIFVLQATFGLLVLLAVVFTLPESRSEATALQAKGEHPFRSYLALLRRPRLMGYVLNGAFSGAALGAGGFDCQSVAFGGKQT
jgi:hypothetical protein